jgi:phage terminase large subunit
MGQAQRIEIPYSPRAAFLPYHDSPQRFKVTVAHRRAGKTVARVNQLIRAALSEQRHGARFGYGAPTYVAAKDIAWSYLKHFSAPAVSATGGRFNESELSVTFGHNNSTVRLYGMENYDRLRGLAFAGMVLDEVQDIAPVALTQVILPALTDWQGWLDVSGTPKGRAGLLYKLHTEAQSKPEEWFGQVLKASDTGILPESELALMRRTMPENEYQQEFECSFDAAVSGAYYAQEIAKAESEGRITAVPYDPSVEVQTFWDLGIADSMSIWFAQAPRGGSVRFIDYYEASGYGLDHYAQVLRDRGYVYGQHWGPHDLQVREIGTGRSRIETAASLGISFKTVPNQSVADGINAARLLLPRCYFDRAKTAQGLECLRQYREKRDEKRDVSMGPLHDFTSHAADAFRYAALAIQEPLLERAKNQRRAYSAGWMAG